jgi:hypothetical protein
MRWWDTGRDRRWLVRYSLGVLVPALLLGGIWWTRNLAVYGGLDVMGLSRHNAVVLGQPTTQAWLAQYGLGATLDRLVRFTFQSFWGMFGWMGLPMPTPIYLGLLVLSVAATLLLVSLAWSRARSIRVRPANYRPALVLGACALLGFLSFCWYNLHFVQHQGRYLFPALIPLAVLAGLALERLVAGMAVLLGGMLAVMAAGIAMRISTLVAASIVSLFAAVVLSLTPRRWHWLLPVAVGAALVALCLYALFGLVVPGLA